MMAMGELISRKALIEDLEAARDNSGMGAVIAATLIRYVKRQKTIDAVEVVRCEECLYRSQYSDKYGMYHCGGIDTTKDHVLPVVAPDFFCAHGERKDNG